eukprot:jgi/Mesen1/3581/ME000020S03112
MRQAVPDNAPGGGKPDALSRIRVDIDGLQRQIDELAKISDHEAPSVTRILFSENDQAARRYVAARMRDAGLQVREDPVGNLYGKWEGSKPELGSILTGSHTDAIPHAGKYDGVLGVLGGVEALAALMRSGFKPMRSLEVVMFTSEEPTRFGYGCLGSRLMANVDGFRDILSAARDKSGASFEEAAAAAGFLDALGQLEGVVVDPERHHAFVELHIEQGPFLEQEGTAIGVVTAIAAPAAIALALAVEAHVLATGSNDTVGTTGKVELLPNAINSVPRDAYVEIDVRDIDGERRNSVLERIELSAQEIAGRRGVELVSFRVLNADPPATCGARVVQAAIDAANRLGLPHKLMVSRAYHDSLFMARLAPTGMIFIPCYKGYSHRPDEFASKLDIEQGVHVLALTMADLSAE